MKISIGSDHAGYEYKEAVKEYLIEQSNIELIDRGTLSPDSVDYPDFAHAVSKDIDSGDFDMGVLFCGSANGVAMTANKHQEVRCAICWTMEITRLARTHNDANIIAIPARFLSLDQAIRYTETFLNTDFEGGRHARRVNKISCS
jgi:ribose 5-phosphate isomerase B